MKKKLERIRDGVKEQRIAVNELLLECEEKMESLSMEQLIGEEGIELAALMDVLFLVERALRTAGEYMENVGKAE